MTQNRSAPTPTEDNFDPAHEAALEKAGDMFRAIQSWCPACGGTGMVMEYGPTDCPYVDEHRLLVRAENAGVA